MGSTISGAVYSEWRMPKLNLGASRLVTYTWKVGGEYEDDKDKTYEDDNDKTCTCHRMITHGKQCMAHQFVS